MLHFRLTLVTLVGWLFLFYNIERIHEPFNIASFVYVLSAAGTCFLMCVGGHRHRLLGTVGASLVLLIVLKSHWNYPILGAALPITVTEAVSMAVTFWLATRLADGVRCFEEGSFELTMALERDNLDQEQTEMYGEVRRAREFDRPLTLAYIRGDTSEFERALHPMIVQSQRSAAERYARARVAEAIGAELRECDMFAIHNDGFVVMLPEADRQRANDIMSRVRRGLSQQFNLHLQAGLASFPDEEVTFAGLLDRAVASSVDAPLELPSEESADSQCESPTWTSQPSHDSAPAFEESTDGQSMGGQTAPSATITAELPLSAIQAAVETAVESGAPAAPTAAPTAPTTETKEDARLVDGEARVSQRYFDPCVSVSLGVTGAENQIKRYMKEVASQLGDRWQRQFNGSSAAIEVDVELTDQPIHPPTDAIEMKGDWFSGSSVYRRLGGDWLRLQGRGDRWLITRPANSRVLCFEQLMFRIGSLRGNGLPLHASVGRFQDIGVAAIGGAECGKTGVLLAQMELGGQWICDDEAYVAQDLVTAFGTSSVMDVKQRYLDQLPGLSRWVSRSDRWSQRFSTATRRVVAGVSMVPRLPSQLRRRLRRMAEGQTSTPISPPGQLPSTPIDVAILVTCGRSAQLKSMEPETWATRVAEVLWPEVREMHELHRRMHAATAGSLITGESQDEQRLREQIVEFAASKQTYHLIRSPQTPVEDLAKLLKPIY